MHQWPEIEGHGSQQRRSTPAQNHDLTGVLLVGGSSRRFGSPKALALFDGETLADRAWRLLGVLCEKRIAVGKQSDGLDLPFELVDDCSEVRAPLAGLVAGLRAMRTAVAIVIPVDCPLLRVEDLEMLATACADAAVSQAGPLPGAFRRTALPVLEHRLTTGELALHSALSQLETRVVMLNPGHLVNANTPEDLAEFAEQK